MWRGYEHALLGYGIAICREWIRRGYDDSLLTEFMAERNTTDLRHGLPWWIGDPKFHRSHRSNLYRKDPIHYEIFSEVGAERPYLWPTVDPGVFKIGTLPKLVTV